MKKIVIPTLLTAAMVIPYTAIFGIDRAESSDYTQKEKSYASSLVAKSASPTSDRRVAQLFYPPVSERHAIMVLGQGQATLPADVAVVELLFTKTEPDAPPTPSPQTKPRRRLPRIPSLPPIRQRIPPPLPPPQRQTPPPPPPLPPPPLPPPQRQTPLPPPPPFVPLPTRIPAQPPATREPTPAKPPILEKQLTPAAPSSVPKAEQSTKQSLKPIVNALVAIGVPETAIEVETLSENPKMTIKLEKPTRDRVKQVVTVAEEAAKKANFTQDASVQYTMNDCQALESAAYKAAAMDAQNRANALASAMGVKLGTPSVVEPFYAIFFPTCSSTSPSNPLSAFGGAVKPPFDPTVPAEVKFAKQIFVTFSVK